MRGSKYLLKNIGLLTISSFGTKLLSFFLVPLYTYMLSTTEYGTYDLFNTTVAVLIPLLTLNISDAVLRFPLDKHSDAKAILTVGLKYFLIGLAPVVFVTLVNQFFTLIPVLKAYSALFVFLYAATALNGIMSSYARGIDHVFDLSVSGIVCSLTIIVLNILLLVVVNWGITGYFIANIAGIAIQAIYLFISTQAWKGLHLPANNSSLEHEMLVYSKPLMANALAWWVNNFSARYVVIWLCGLAENGIFSVAYKIPSILNIFQTIFGQAWTLSATQDFDPEDRHGFFARTYGYYNFGMTVICSLLIAGDRLMARLLYAKDFYIAWMSVPFLLISIVFGALSGYAGGVFSAVKDAKKIASSTVIGAAVNIILDFFLVFAFKSVGAAIANMVSYWLVWFIRMRQLRQFMTIRINFARDNIAYLILLIQSSLLLAFRQENLGLYASETVLFLLILALFYKEGIRLARKLIGAFTHFAPTRQKGKHQ
ncbi:lipopolysaccharide biosynthesis protein [Bifidobacterium felsineum]|uniref:Polysaccharide biosynthesis protein n=1 Tax=Bifidobacterium felsineum TaxID=2045440 RepID=A0A2M9HHX9_9BIFI|nr:polysaccharide biosynthesis C-terminal domain-containing protein [Bifidobacterium felsineum]PJM76397.1 polysaccharide biosynthesis protein [Bifidobacterium felsineum]